MKRMFVMFLTILSIVSCKKVENQENEILALFDTNYGSFTCKIFYDKVPLIAGNFIGLAEGSLEFTDAKTNEKQKKPFYDGLIFHRIIKGFMIQGGCPLGMGYGGPGYSVEDQFDPSLKHDSAGILSMANSGPNTNGSQFFITLAPTPHLDGRHSVFGEVVDGMNVVMTIGDVSTDASSNKPYNPVVINKISITRKGDDAIKFNPAEEFKNIEKNKKKQLTNFLKKLNVKESKIVTDKSGLQYYVVREGSGEKPQVGNKVSAHYTGYLTNGSKFDSSYDRKQPIEFPVGVQNVIPGWDIALLDMKVGEKRVLIIPYNLAYGERGYPGVIPPKATLIFEVELIKIN
ncbi:MAG TPA: peptidylprolyl isomerase [Spirochaetota bacterium]|mgnify:CR=1 FL=1|nr:MAG: putative peptidyl-prolyl cis-trans isomerase [Spirochaetes bacterium ADurb.Bin133]HNZ28018.1 peptidylprolyl isomerase [Spirochaetota bacterium]HPY88057.1 peptidylprolyl isomerase [Spirochaetota bacterium]